MAATDDSLDRRSGQRKRTRSAILDAARAMIERGEIPTVPDAAEAAEVSRATAYRYFPSRGALVMALVDLTATEASEIEFESANAAGRLREATAIAHELIDASEPAMRGALRLGLEQWAARRLGEEPDEPIRRGGRLPVIDKALEPLSGSLSATEYERLRAALAMFFGVEARVVMGDIMGLDEARQRAVCEWAVGALLAAATDEAGS